MTSARLFTRRPETGFRRCFFDIKNARQQHAGVPNQEPAGLKQDAHLEVLQKGDSRPCVILDRQRMLGFVFFPPDLVSALQRTAINNADSSSDAEELDAAIGF